jgi:hypothetical protein
MRMRYRMISSYMPMATGPRNACTHEVSEGSFLETVSRVYAYLHDKICRGASGEAQTPCQSTNLVRARLEVLPWRTFPDGHQPIAGERVYII